LASKIDNERRAIGRKREAEVRSLEQLRDSFGTGVERHTNGEGDGGYEPLDRGAHSPLSAATSSVARVSPSLLQEITMGRQQTEQSST
jgi:hypothetical protein